MSCEPATNKKSQTPTGESLHRNIDVNKSAIAKKIIHDRQTLSISENLSLKSNMSATCRTNPMK